MVNVTASNFTSFYLSTGESSVSSACNQHVGTLRYHNGSSATPSSGDTVYTDAQGTTVLNGSTGPYFAWAPGGGAHNGSGTSFYAQIDSSGSVGTVNLCS